MHLMLEPTAHGTKCIWFFGLDQLSVFDDANFELVIALLDRVCCKGRPPMVEVDSASNVVTTLAFELPMDLADNTYTVVKSVMENSGIRFKETN